VYARTNGTLFYSIPDNRAGRPLRLADALLLALKSQHINIIRTQQNAAGSLNNQTVWRKGKFSFSFYRNFFLDFLVDRHNILFQQQDIPGHPWKRNRGGNLWG
jgi:hypothetical protein